MISVCIVTGRRNDQLDECLRCLADQECAPPFELLVCADADPEVEDAVRRRFPDATVVLVAKTRPGAGRNRLIERARGDLLLFLDDDIVFDPDLLARLAGLARSHPDISVFGGPNNTPRGSSHFQIVQGAVLGSLVASGPVRRRYGPHPAGAADERWFILCNLAVRREAMRHFDEDLICAEENALLNELHDAGERMHYDPGLAVFHERRPRLAGFAQQMHKYGRGRGQVIRRNPQWTHPVYLLPSVLLSYLVAAPVLALVSPLAVLPVALYLGAVTAGGAKVAVSVRNPLAFPLACLLVAVVHVFYGAGVIREMIRPARREVAPQTAPERTDPIFPAP